MLGPPCALRGRFVREQLARLAQARLADDRPIRLSVPVARDDDDSRTLVVRLILHYERLRVSSSRVLVVGSVVVSRITRTSESEANIPFCFQRLVLSVFFFLFLCLGHT